MRKILSLLVALGGLFFVTSAHATVQIAINLSSQSMHVTSSSGSYNWPVSTARSGYATPRGSYAPYSLQRMHYSKKYHMSPMPYSIFFLGGYAIHGTYSTGQLGRPASHGCIRLAPGNAAKLFGMVKAEGAAISITGTPPGHTMYAKAHHKHPTALAEAHHHRANPLAYAPSHAAPWTVKAWQYDPTWR